MFGTYIRGGELLVYPFYEYYFNSDEPYTPEELGYEGEEEYEGKVVQHEFLIFIAYGFSDGFALEFEAAVYTTETLKKDPDDPSNVPDEVTESGLGDVEGQLRWRWFEETESRPELFSYFEVVLPLQKDKVLIGTSDWEFKPGIGAIKGFAWGTLTARAAIEYTTEDNKFEPGEFALEYLKRASESWRFFLGYEGSGEEAAAIFEVQWFIEPDMYVKVNNGFGVTPATPEFAPEIGVMMVF